MFLETMIYLRDFEYVVVFFLPSDERVRRNIVLDHEARVHGREVETRHTIVESHLRLENNSSLVGDDGLFHSGGDELAEGVSLHNQIIVYAESNSRCNHMVRRQPCKRYHIDDIVDMFLYFLVTVVAMP